MNKIRTGLVMAVLGTTLLAIFVCAVPASARHDQQAAPQSRPRTNFPPDIMGIPGWVLAGAPRSFAKTNLYGYIDGGAEIVLQYGFQALKVYELVPEKKAAEKKSITLEIFRMDSPASAFGIFSTRREGGERTSPRIKATHWIAPGQANFVKGEFYVNILATACTEAEIEDFAAALEPELPQGVSPLPDALSWMPKFDLIHGSERYIRGDLAAANESPLLGADFWGFKEGQAEAFSARYGPANSRLVLIHFKKPPENLTKSVLGLFGEALTHMYVRDSIIQGRSPGGQYYLFGQYYSLGEPRWRGAALILGEPDIKTARSRLQEALDKAAKGTEEKTEKKSDEKK
jgi:hypothetical protein